VTLFSFQFLGEFKALTESRMRTTTPRCATATSAAEGAAGGSSAGDSGGVVAEPETTIAAQLAGSYSDRALVLCSVVHNADLANCAKTWNLAKAWTYRLMDEFCEVLTAATHCHPLPTSPTVIVASTAAAATTVTAATYCHPLPLPCHKCCRYHHRIDSSTTAAPATTAIVDCHSH